MSTTENRLSTRRCQDCGESKPLAAFPIKGRGRRGQPWFHGRCKPCRNRHDTPYKVAWAKARRPKTLQRYADLRRGAILGYGARCFCCGEDGWEFLTIDHVDRSYTKADRKKQPAAFYAEIVAAGWPDRYRVACLNCNWASRFDGVCPHHRRALSLVALAGKGA